MNASGQDTSTDAPPPSTGLLARRRNGAVLLVSALGTFMVFLDVTIVSVALPHISDDLRSTSGIEWVVSAYLLALGVAQPVTGWMAARFGAKRSLLVTFGLFGLTSVAAGLAPTLPLLIAARALQGMSGGLIVPLSMTILFAVFPPETRGRAIGISGMVVMAAPALGPILSGYVLTVTSWRWLMLLNAPVAAAGIFLGSRCIPDTGERNRRPLDLAGLVLVGSGLALVLYGFSRTEAGGWAAPSFLAAALTGLVLLGVYVRRSLRIDHPLVDLGIFRHRAFSVSVAIAWTISLAQFGRTVFIPVQLQVIRGLSALEAGTALALSGVASGLVMPIAGRWIDRSGGRTPVVTGTLLLAAAVARLATLGVQTPLWHVLAALAAMGFGIVLVTMPTTVVALNAVPPHLVTEAASVRSLNREVAGAVSTSILAAVVAARAGGLGTTAVADAAALTRQQDAYNAAFALAFVGVLVALVLALTLPSRPEHHRDSPGPDQEGDAQRTEPGGPTGDRPATPPASGPSPARPGAGRPIR